MIWEDNTYDSDSDIELVSSPKIISGLNRFPSIRTDSEIDESIFEV